MSVSLTHPFSSDSSSQKTRYGTFLGVYVPSILMMFGVIIFLRLGWIVGAAGLYTSLVIVTLATLITFITTLSMSATATNIEVGKGGIYFMLSRSLGIEMGSAIGLSLFLKQGIAIAFCIVGFAESFRDLFPQFSIQMIGIVTLLILTLLAYLSTQFMLTIQVAIFAILILALYSLFGGGEYHPGTNLYTNSSSPPFWTIFAIFFPALTGTESSVSLSGDLKNPNRSLPLGTISAVLTAYIVYALIPIFLWYHVPQDLLVSDPLIMQHIAKYESLIILGIWGATLSSAIGGLLGAPRTLQALAEDGVLPRILGREFGENREPRVATCLTCLLALAGICFGSINMIAPLLTMICLICYALVNLATGMEGLMANPSWRPAFPLPWPIAMTGAILCLVAMLMINSGAAILAIVGICLVYALIKRKNFNTTWDDIRYGILMFFSRSIVYHLAYATPCSKSWRPNFLVFTGKPSQVSSHLLSFSSAITQTKGFLTIASFLTKQGQDSSHIQRLSEEVKSLLKMFRIEALLYLHLTKHVPTGMKQMLSHYGMGPLTPNTIVCGGTSKEDNLLEYLEVLKTAYQMGKNIIIINDEPKTFISQNQPSHKLPRIKGEIHIWWDEHVQKNSELMLILAYMLKKNPNWRSTSLHLISVVSDEHIREERQNELNKMIERNRFKIKTTILVADTQQKNLLSLIQSYSAHTVMVLMGMKPFDPNESLEHYAQYFQELPHKTADSPPIALVLSSNKINFQEVVNLKIEG